MFISSLSSSLSHTENCSYKWPAPEMETFFISRGCPHIPCEQRLQFRCVSCHTKSSLCRHLFNSLLCMREIRHAIHNPLKSNHYVCHQIAKFQGNEKITTTLMCYTRLMQDSHNALNRSTRGKNPFFSLFIQISGQI